jgi:hypothetical protein
MKTPHDGCHGHRDLVLTMAMDLSAARRQPLHLPVDLEEFYR